MEEQNLIYWHPHNNHDRIKNANEIHQQLHRSTFNQKIAVFLTKNVGSMWTAYLFIVIACIGLGSILGYFNPFVALLVAWVSQTFIQLVLLPVIMVGQNVLSKHQEIQANVMFENTKETVDDERKSIEHLNAQDAELMKQTEIIVKILHIVIHQNNHLQELQGDIYRAIESLPKKRVTKKL